LFCFVFNSGSCVALPLGQYHSPLIFK
jgi:hypothetical protein